MAVPPLDKQMRFMQDDDTLYIGIKVVNTNYHSARVSPREDVNDDDQIGILSIPLEMDAQAISFISQPHWNPARHALFQRSMDDGVEYHLRQQGPRSGQRLYT